MSVILETDPFTAGQEFGSGKEWIQAAKSKAERGGFKVNYRTSVVECKVFCPLAFGTSKCSFRVTLQKISEAYGRGSNLWFVSDAETTHSGHCPSPIDPRKMTRGEMRTLSAEFASLKTNSPPTTPSRRSSARSDASSSTQYSVDSEPPPSRSPCTGPKVDELQHLKPDSPVSALLDTVYLYTDDYHNGLVQAGADCVEDLVWLGSEELRHLLCEEIGMKTVHALRIISTMRILEERFGRAARVKMEPVD